MNTKWIKLTKEKIKLPLFTCTFILKRSYKFFHKAHRYNKPFCKTAEDQVHIEKALAIIHNDNELREKWETSPIP